MAGEHQVQLSAPVASELENGVVHWAYDARRMSRHRSCTVASTYSQVRREIEQLRTGPDLGKIAYSTVAHTVCEHLDVIATIV